MKTFLLLLSLCLSASAQDRVFVLFSVPPASTSLPANAYYVSDTNTAPTNAWVAFSEAAWTDYLFTNRALFASWKTNPANPSYQVQTNASIVVNSNIAALIFAYSNLNFVAQNWGSVTNLPTAKFAIQAEGDVLLKLRPFLIQMYQGQ